MKDIELPPRPEPDICRYVVTVWRDGVECEIDKGPRYTVEQMQAYARAAVEADRAQRVPDVEAALDRFESRERGIPQAHIAAQLASELRALLASTPAPAQQSGWTEESGLVIDFANRVELACYDQGSAECMAAVQEILDGKDRGDGVANEPWESIRRRLISLVAPAPAQQEPMEAFLVIDLSRELGVAASELIKELRDQGIGNYSVNMALPKSAAAAMRAHFKSAAQHQEPPQQERKPMTDEVVREGFAACGVGGINARLGFVEGVKFAERHHGIKE